MFQSGVIIHLRLTDTAVFADVATEERHRGKQSQGLFDHTLQVSELLQVLCVNGPVGGTFAEHNIHVNW